MSEPDKLAEILSEDYPELFKLYQDKKLFVQGDEIFLFKEPLIVKKKESIEGVLKAKTENSPPDFCIIDNKIFFPKTELKYIDPKNRDNSYFNEIKTKNTKEEKGQIALWKNSSDHYFLSFEEGGGNYHLPHAHNNKIDELNYYKDNELGFSSQFLSKTVKDAWKNYGASLLSTSSLVALSAMVFENPIISVPTGLIAIISVPTINKFLTDLSLNNGFLEIAYKQKIAMDALYLPASEKQLQVLQKDLEIDYKLGTVNYNIYNINSGDNCVKYLFGKLKNIGIDAKELVKDKSQNIRDFFVKTHNFLVADKIKTFQEPNLKLVVKDYKNNSFRFNFYQSEGVVFFENKDKAKFIAWEKCNGVTKGILATTEFLDELLKENGVEIKNGKILLNGQNLTENLLIEKKLIRNEDKEVDRKPSSKIVKLAAHTLKVLNYIIPRV